MARRLALTIVVCLSAVSLSADTRPVPAPALPTVLTRIVPASYTLTRETQGTLTVQSVQLALDRLLADRWYPAAAQKSMGIATDEATMKSAFISDNPAIRRVVVRGLGQFENPLDVPVLEGMLIDKDASVRREAANAIAQALFRSKGVDVVPASEVLLSRLASESDAATQAAIRDALARLHYNSQTVEAGVLSVLIQNPEDAVVLLRNDRTLKVTDEQRKILHRQAWPDNPRVGPSPAAIEALGIIGDTDAALINWAVLWHCPLGPPTCGWEGRYEAVQRMDAANPLFETSLNIARRDAAYQVRMAALRRYALAIPRTRDCTRIVEAIGDAQELTVVKLDAISRLSSTCEQPQNLAAIVGDLASGLSSELPVGQWHVGMPAFEALSKIDPDKARQVMTDAAVVSDVWQVRAAAARVATTLKDEAMLIRLADDRHPNVQTQALSGLASLKSAGTRELALKALDAKDYQLIRQAALALQGTKEIDATALPIFQTLDRLTKEGKDTSRDPRMALMTRLKEFAPLDSTGTSPILQWRDELKKYLSDFDPSVASAAAAILGIINGSRPDPTPTHRAPQQPTELELRNLPSRASVFFEDGGLICMNLNKDDAPLTVARFVKLANAHYYDNLTFHRLVPLFVAQGLSPGANEYTGDARYLRDELGLAHHTRGAVGISTRGRDTGDGQIFFDLISQPRLDHDYTVFANVYAPSSGECSASLDNMDKILDAAKVIRVTFQQ
jgi:cyclophilin family peptidyl-prolyl cis-trans isomerase/HEAT repeat protein